MEWISVEDLPPPQGLRVLLWCYTRVPNVFIGYLRGWRDDRWKFAIYETGESVSSVSHWHALPPEPSDLWYREGCEDCVPLPWRRRFNPLLRRLFGLELTAIIRDGEVIGIGIRKWLR